MCSFECFWASWLAGCYLDFYYCFPLHPVLWVSSGTAAPSTEGNTLLKTKRDRQTDRLGGRRWETVMIMMCVSMGGWHLWQHVSSADPDTTRERQGGHCFPVAAFGSLSGSYDDKSRAKHMCMFKLKECKIQKKLRSLYSIVGIINVLRFKLN